MCNQSFRINYYSDYYKKNYTEMKHFTARLRLPKLSKILIQNDRLNMSPVEEDCED